MLWITPDRAKEASLQCLIGLVRGCSVRVSTIDAIVGKFMRRKGDLHLRRQQASSLFRRETVVDKINRYRSPGSG